MDEFPENDEQTQDASDREASEAAERELTDEAMPTRDEEKAPPAGEGGMPEEEDVLPSEQAQEASLTGFEEATEQQRDAVVAEMAEQAAEATDEDAAPAAEEAAVQTVEELEEPIEGSVAEEPEEPAAPPSEAPTEDAPAADQEVAAPGPEAEAPSDAFSGPGDWYVIHTYAGYENKVKTNLESRIQTMQMQDKIFSVYIPMEDVMEIKGGRKQVVQKKVFPGYLLVRMEYDDDSWYVVRNTPGVTGFVAAGTGQKPTPLPRHEVEKFLAPQKEEAKPQFRLEFEEGDVVRIIAGPFADFNGTISEINVDQSKVKVMVNIFDRETPVELSFDQVARV